MRRSFFFNAVIGVACLAVCAAANIRAMTPADRPGTPEYSVERFLAALWSGDADAALAYFDDTPWLGTEWEEEARANRAQLEGLTPGDDPGFVHYPTRRAVSDGVAPDLGDAAVVVCEADFAQIDDAGTWGEPFPCVFYMMRIDGVWKVTLWKARD
jgi:hypothetical protein